MDQIYDELVLKKIGYSDEDIDSFDEIKQKKNELLPPSFKEATNAINNLRSYIHYPPTNNWTPVIA